MWIVNGIVRETFSQWNSNNKRIIWIHMKITCFFFLLIHFWRLFGAEFDIRLENALIERKSMWKVISLLSQRGRRYSNRNVDDPKQGISMCQNIFYKLHFKRFIDSYFIWIPKIHQNHPSIPKWKMLQWIMPSEIGYLKIKIIEIIPKYSL